MTSSTADSSITVLDILVVVMLAPFVLGTSCFTPGSYTDRLEQSTVRRVATVNEASLGTPTQPTETCNNEA